MPILTHMDGIHRTNQCLLAGCIQDMAALQPALEDRLVRTKSIMVELLRRIEQVIPELSPPAKCHPGLTVNGVCQNTNSTVPFIKSDELLSARRAKSEALAYRDMCISVGAPIFDVHDVQCGEG